MDDTRGVGERDQDMTEIESRDHHQYMQLYRPVREEVRYLIEVDTRIPGININKYIFESKDEDVITLFSEEELDRIILMLQAAGKKAKEIGLWAEEEKERRDNP